VIVAAGGRLFETHPAAVVAAIVNRDEELLLLESPLRPDWWEPVNGAVESEETLLEAALREVREEVGADMQVRPLGVVHASTFAYDAQVTHMISVTYLMAHIDGVPRPGDDMRGSRVRWATLDEIDSRALRLVPPLDQAWLRQRTIELFRLWEPAPDAPLQIDLTLSGWNKHDHAH
jgi:8-oxo-dGTP pyrophosphatase MutT (NUDIX family)